MSWKSRSLFVLTVIGGIVALAFTLLGDNQVYAATTFEVTIPEGAADSGNHFEPQTATVAKGSTVIWNNKDTTLHTVTSGTPDGGNSGIQFDSSYLGADKTFEHQFNKQGTFKYYCTLHPAMVGKVVVSKGGAKTEPSINTAEKLPPIQVDTAPNTNINVSQWSNFTDSDQRFSVQYPSHWSVTQSGNRFTEQLPLVVDDVNGSSSKIQSQLSINVFKKSPSFDNSNQLAKLAFNQLVKDITGNKLVEPISCDKYLIGGEKACSFVYSGSDKEGKRYGVLAIVLVGPDNTNHIISYRADPLNFDTEQQTMDRIISSYSPKQ